MLCNIDIKNVAVIENLSFSPSGGMSVLTGETGAGKSVIIDCVNLILGARTNKNLIRYGEKKASVCAMFTPNKELAERLSAAGIDFDEEIIIRREITEDGKSVARINTNMVPASFLREIAPYLIDIHGQHDNQMLLNPSKHIDYLDAFAGLYEQRQEYRELYDKLKKINTEIETLNKNEQERLARIDLLEYQINELASAELKDGEEEALKEESVLISSSEHLSKSAAEAYAYLYDGECNAYDFLNKAVNAIGDGSCPDKSLSQICDRISEALYNIQDCAGELRDYAEKTEFDEERLDFVEERLDLIKKLERKYGATVGECIEYLKKAEDELDVLKNSDEKTAELSKEKEKITKDLSKIAEKLSKKREQAAKDLSAKIESELHDLDMPRAKFSAEITKAEDFKSYGVDVVEFMFTANPGQPLAELAKIASGGELSRVMLAMKSVLSKDEGAETLIFDEIDTGVSGNAAMKIADKLSALGKFKQVICVSHLPQLAAAADNNYKIEKRTEADKTSTTISQLDYEGRVSELARMIDGEKITKASSEHAREMLERRGAK